MPVIREFHPCGHCGRKQAGVQYFAGHDGTRWYQVRCRACSCSLRYGEYGDFPAAAWPGGEEAAARLVDSQQARSERMHAARQKRNDQIERAWEAVLDAARQVVVARDDATVSRLAAAIERLEWLEETADEYVRAAAIAP